MNTIRPNNRRPTKHNDPATLCEGLQNIAQEVIIQLVIDMHSLDTDIQRDAAVFIIRYPDDFDFWIEFSGFADYKNAIVAMAEKIVLGYKWGINA